MNAEPTDGATSADTQLAKIAGAIAEPARTRMLCALMDGRARTSTELAVIAEVSPSTASVHLSKLREQHLVEVLAQGKHRYYKLASPQVALALESLMQIADIPKPRFVPSTPDRLRKARTCYDHMAGEIAVGIHDFLIQRKWIIQLKAELSDYDLTATGAKALEDLGVDITGTRKTRRRFACACLDWSERKPHVGGALGAALLRHLLQNAWVETDLDSRALSITSKGKRQLQHVFDLNL